MKHWKAILALLMLVATSCAPAAAPTPTPKPVEVLADLNSSEITAMLETIREIRDRGITIIMIEHVMHAIMNVSEHILVLNFGELIAEGTPEEIANNEQVIEAYLGDPRLAARLMQQND